MRRIGLALAVLLVAAVGCGSDDAETIEATGTITFVDLEGGFYGIVADGGAHYDPMNLPTEMAQNGLRVSFTARERDDVASIHQWGCVIEVLSIEEL